MSDDRTLRVRFVAEYQSYVQGLRKAGDATKEFGREVSGRGKAVQMDVERVGRSALLMSGSLALGLGLAAKAAIDWESSWAGVLKTVDGTSDELERLEGGLRRMASEIPASHGEIAAVAEAAGQLGVKVGDVEAFSKVMLDLGETTNLSADQAATSLARLANIMGTDITADIERLGSTIVELGNNSETTEAEIVEFATRLAAAGNIAGLSEADVLAFAATLTSVGVGAEAGGTALSKVFTSIRDAVIDGGENLETFAEVAGTTAAEFSQSFRDDPAMAIESFIAGLGRMNAAGQSTSGVFEDLSLTDQRLKRALLSTAEAGTHLADRIAMGNQAWEDNNALQTEAELRYGTTAAQLEMLRNQVTDLGIGLGATLLPAIREVVDILGTMVSGFADLPKPIQTSLVAFTALSTVGLGAIGIMGTLAPKVIAAQKALMSMGAAGQFVGRNLSRMGIAAAGVFAAIGAVSYVMGQNAKAAREAEEQVKGYSDAIREAGDASAGTQAQIVQLVQDVPELADLLDDAGVSAEDLGAAIAGTDEDYAAMRARLLEVAEAGGITGLKLEALEGALDSQRGAALEGAEQAETLGRVLGDTGDAAKDAAPQFGSLADEMGLTAEEAEAAREAFEDLLDAYRGAVDPLFSMLDALEKNRQAQAKEAEMRAEGAKAVAEATETVADAEKALRDARGTEDNAAGIAAAEERLADARERLIEAEADAVISAEELNAIYRDVAKSALDVEVAARELAVQIADQPGLLDESVRMLKEWEEQGLITAEQAYNIALQFQHAADKGDEFAGEYVAEVYADTSGAMRSLSDLIKFFNGNRVLAFDVKAAQTGDRLVRHSGGMVDESGPFTRRPPASDDVPAWLQRGEGVLNRKAMALLGERGLDQLNAGQMFHQGDLAALTMGSGGVAGSSSSYDYSRSVQMSVSPTIVEARSPQSTAKDVIFEAKVMAAMMGAG